MSLPDPLAFGLTFGVGLIVGVPVALRLAWLAWARGIRGGLWR